jgi:Zn-dependent metalloprotease
MFKPSLDGASPDRYSSNIGSLDVHYSSGIGDHFFYLLAQGAVVPTGFNLTPGQRVCNGNTALQAAADLYGSGSTQYNTVGAAWAAVNVN